MSHAEPVKKQAHYFGIYDGEFRLPTTEHDTEATPRDWKSPDGSRSGTKYERRYKYLTGFITDIGFFDGEYGKNLNITLDENEDGVAPVISIKADSRYADDFLKRLPNVKLNEEVRLIPYDFEPNEGPRKTGMSVAHRISTGEFNDKVQNFFVKEVEKEGKKTWVNQNGYPEPDEEDRSDWAFYFKKVNKFLVKYTQENVIPKLQEIKTDNATKTPKTFEQQERKRSQEEIDEDIDVSNIPF